MAQIRKLEEKEFSLPLAALSPADAAPNDGTPANGNGHVLAETLRSPEAHPLARLAGKYNDEPLWNDFFQAMQDVRRQMNAQEEDAEKTDVHAGLG